MVILLGLRVILTIAVQISHTDNPMFILGYLQRDQRIYLADKDVNVYSYTLSLSVVEYQTAVLRDDMEAANEILPTVPKEQRNKIATFLESRGTPIGRIIRFSSRLTVDI